MMMDHREIECVQLAWVAKQGVAKRRLTDFCARKFKSPLSGMSLWPREHVDARQLLLLPIFLLIMLLTALATPIAYIVYMAKRTTAKREFLRISEAHFTPSEVEVSNCKQIDALWQCCELPDGLEMGESAALLSAWLEILYGTCVARSVNADARVHEIATRQINANRPYYEGREDAPHFSFVLPINVLIRELTEQLPRYSEVRRTPTEPGVVSNSQDHGQQARRLGQSTAPPPLYFKDGEAAFEYACKNMDCHVCDGALLPAIVVDAHEIYGAPCAVKVQDDGNQLATLRVPSHDGGFLAVATTANPNGPALQVGNLVAWQAGHYSKSFAIIAKDKRFGWVGLIIGTLKPELANGKWVGGDRYLP